MRFEETHNKLKVLWDNFINDNTAILDINKELSYNNTDNKLLKLGKLVQYTTGWYPVLLSEDDYYAGLNMLVRDYTLTVRIAEDFLPYLSVITPYRFMGSKPSSVTKQDTCTIIYKTERYNQYDISTNFVMANTNHIVQCQFIFQFINPY